MFTLGHLGIKTNEEMFESKGEGQIYDMFDLHLTKINMQYFATLKEFFKNKKVRRSTVGVLMQKEENILDVVQEFDVIAQVFSKSFFYDLIFSR